MLGGGEETVAELAVVAGRRGGYFLNAPPPSTARFSPRAVGPEMLGGYFCLQASKLPGISSILFGVLQVVWGRAAPAPISRETERGQEVTLAL